MDFNVIMVAKAGGMLRLVNVRYFVRQSHRCVLCKQFVRSERIDLMFQFRFVVRGFRLITMMCSHLPNVRFVAICRRLSVFSIKAFIIHPIIVNVGFNVRYRFYRRRDGRQADSAPVVEPKLVTICLQGW